MKELTAFGLSEHESEIYIALLKAGRVTANRIATITGLKRSTTYDNLSLLMNKGIVSQTIIDNVYQYEAAEPEKLVQILEERKEAVKRVVPELRSIKELITERPGVSYFEGKKGAVSVLSDIFEEKEELLFYGSRKKARDVLATYPESFAKKRTELGIKLRAVLAEEDRKDPLYRDPIVGKLSKLRFSKDLDGIPANVFIYNGKVSFLTSTANIAGFIVKNKDLYNQQKKIFDMLWARAKP